MKNDYFWEAVILGICLMIAADIVDINININIDGKAVASNE